MGVKTDKTMARAIGERIAQARHEAGGMTQRELAELIGVTERSVAAYEAGDVIPYRFFRKIEDATGSSAAWLLHGEKRPNQEESRVIELLEQILHAIREAPPRAPAEESAPAPPA